MPHARAIPTLFAVAVLALLGCDQALNPTIASLGAHATSGSDTAIALVITPASPQLTIGQTSQLSTNAGTSLGSILWTSSNVTIAAVSSTGVVTAVGTGTATITAKSTVDTLATGSTLVTVGQ